MEPEAFFRIAFFTLSAAVLTMVVAGVVLWGRWLVAKFHRGTTVGIRNLCGDLNPELITELPKPFPRWSMFDFFLMFGLMILAGSLLQPVDTAPIDTAPVAIDDVESIAMETLSNDTTEEDPATKNPTADENLSEVSPGIDVFSERSCPDSFCRERDCSCPDVAVFKIGAPRLARPSNADPDA